ncbi:MAG TPA: DEAD/DEAH box helicase [Vicinamibacteria bacterium]|nr:DEAD/DEAH box helicase [Vicinamibacteria bacterium]
MDLFGPSVVSWFETSFEEPTRVQREGWPIVARGENALLLAPTGSGKTLAAFLWAIDRLTRLAPDAPPGVRILYVSPLKALVYDVERNLRAPLAGISRRVEPGLREIRVDVRTGDTSSRERRLQSRDPSDILVTTPESLFLILGSQARATLHSVNTVIVDEIHSLAGTKRGVHLALSLERLSDLTEREPQRIGLSATVRPAGDVARFLGGSRDVTVVDASEPAHIELAIRVPVPDMENIGSTADAEVSGPDAPSPREPGSLWSRIYPELLTLIRNHRSTIVFVNSRSLAERIAQRLNELAGMPLVSAHHGSLSHVKRNEIEESLKIGSVKGIVATSSLELGIDMGSVELVILVESPGSVARGLQRVGRSGHAVGEKSRGIIFPKFRGDLLECAVTASRMLDSAIESIRVPENPLDVLSQQIVAIVADAPRSVDEIETLVKRAFPYRELSREVLVSVLDMLTGHYPSEDLADLRPRIVWDRARDVLTPRKGAKMIALLNAGTIPDRGLFGVHLGEGGPRVGELDEEMVYESRRGDIFYLGASSWRVEAITRDRVIVSPAPGEPGKMPFWKGDGPGRPLELGRAIGAFVRELWETAPAERRNWLMKRAPLDNFAAANLGRYIEEQKEHTGSLPTDREITVERFRDELGDWRIAVLTPFGSRVHAPWALAIQNVLSSRAGYEVETMYTDDGIVLRLSEVDEPLSLELLLPDPDEVEDRVVDELGGSALFASAFRENAARALLLPRRRAEQRTPLWQQRLRAKNLLGAVRRFSSFPIVLETYRQCLRDVFDLPALGEVLRGIQSRTIRVHDVETSSASPFSRSLTFAYVANYLYEQDAPLAERKAQALTLDRGLLRELLGQAELRDLIDAEVLQEVEDELSRKAEGWRARNPDELEDLLRRCGDLSRSEITARTTEDPQPWIGKLTDERRAVEVLLCGEPRFIAITDAGRYRDALGCVLPADLPIGVLATVEHPLTGVMLRYALSHGPFTTESVAHRYGLLPEQLEPVLRRLESDGRLVLGEIRPLGSRAEWCDPDVLRRLKRRTLAKLRKEAAPVEASVLGSFLPAWHGLAEPGKGLTRLTEAIDRLEGLPLPWSSLIESVLPRRVTDFRLEMLDMLSASGAIVWIGAGALGPRDGRIVLYRRERAPLLLPSPEAYEPQTELERAVLEHLEHRGASFTVELAPKDVSFRDLEQALRSLMWAGCITNDTFFPLRALGKSAKPRASRGSRGSTGKYGGGRWSLVKGLADPAIAETESAHARITMLLERYGLVSRAAAGFEDLPGGYQAIYPLLREMEERGRLRRGHFVEGLSGSQFALPGAVERLRASRIQKGPEGNAYLAVDPANPYGAILPWPSNEKASARPRRVAGAWVVLHRGRLVLYLERGGRSLLTFGEFSDPNVARAAIETLVNLPTSRPRRLRIASIDDEPPTESRHGPLLQELGFFREATAMVYAEHPRA